MLFIWLNFWVVEKEGERERLCVCFRLYRSVSCVRVIVVLFGDLLLSESDISTTEAGSSCVSSNEIEVKVREGRFLLFLSCKWRSDGCCHCVAPSSL